MDLHVQASWHWESPRAPTSTSTNVDFVKWGFAVEVVVDDGDIAERVYDGVLVQRKQSSFKNSVCLVCARGGAILEAAGRAHNDKNANKMERDS